LEVQLGRTASGSKRTQATQCWVRAKRPIHCWP